MRRPLRFRGFVSATLLLLATGAAGCSAGESAEAGAVGTTGDLLAVTFSSTYLTVENRTGVPIVGGEIQILPRGVMPPFRTPMPRIEGSARRDMVFSQFRSKDGTPYRRGAVRTRAVRITATDVTGKKIEQEIAFD